MHLLKALETNPEFSEVHFQLALMYQQWRDFKTAEAHFRKAIKSDYKQTREIEKHGKELLKKFQFQNANFLFMKAQAKRHHCARVNFHFSNFYEKLNKFEKAQTCLKNSIKLNPIYPKAHRNLGILLYKQKSYAAARLQIEKALDLDYSDCLSHLNLGIITKQRKDYANAELHFLVALDINPNYVVCLYEMTLLQLLMKNQIKARKYYKKARKISPSIRHSELDKILG